jgi:hypothetical protein
VVAHPGEEKRRINLYGCYDRRYLVELIPAIAALLLAVGIAVWVPRTPAMRLWLAGLTSTVVAYTAVVTVAAIRRLDELQQRIQLIGVAVSFAVTGVVLAMTPFLERAGVRSIPTGMGLWCLMFIVWAIAVVVLSLRYR